MENGAFLGRMAENPAAWMLVAEGLRQASAWSRIPLLLLWPRRAVALARFEFWISVISAWTGPISWHVIAMIPVLSEHGYRPGRQRVSVYI
jgi:hypothetical protein